MFEKILRRFRHVLEFVCEKLRKHPLGDAPPPHDSNDWPTFARLASLDERERRRVLRSHTEAGFRWDDGESIELRQELDKELDRLAELELRAQSAKAGIEQTARAAEIQAIPSFAALIAESPSFTQYLNSYLFFGVRFAAGRLENPCTAVGHAEDRFNDRPVGLPSPPVCEGTEGAVDRFLSIESTPKAVEALAFLDGFVTYSGEAPKFELWLRGLYSTAHDEENARFLGIAQGLYEWAASRRDFFVSLEEQSGQSERLDLWREGTWVEGQWKVTNPLAARCGVVDLYWMALILRAEVSPRAVVRYKDDRSWLSYLPSLNAAEQKYAKEEIIRIEEVLRSVFDYACDLIQNAIEMAEYCERKRVQPDDCPDRPWTEDWRAAFDRELTEVANQRKERVYLDQRNLTASAPFNKEGRADQYWSRRIRNGEGQENLVGLAISGGGIRSATFGLGVLQRLKELDLLRQVDYLSTVSGGGYIGAWLLGNVRRNHYWLSRMTSWEESIGHLRRYSKYLAPQAGLLSADTWVIWGTWFRNAFLIQLTAVAWLAASFVTALEVKKCFEWVGGAVLSDALLGVFFTVLAVIIGKNIWGQSFRRNRDYLAFGRVWLGPLLAGKNLWVQRFRTNQHHWAAGLAWLGSFLTAALLWRPAQDYKVKEHYSEVLTAVFQNRPFLVLMAVLFVCLVVLASISFLTKKKLTKQNLLGSFGVAVLSLVVVYLALCGVIYLFGWWASSCKHQYGWYAYVFGPTLVLLAVTLGVVVFIGLIGGTSDDWKREWWTRYGSWLAIYGAGFMALSLVAVFGPVWIAKLFNLPWKSVKWGAVIAWVASVIAGLFAGNSDKTKGNGRGSSIALEWVAKIGGVLFIVGAVLMVSSLLRLAMVQIWDQPRIEWWSNLDHFLNDPALKNSITSSTALLLMKPMIITLIVLLFCGLVFSWRFNLNVFGLNQFYRNRLVRCYLGATRWKPGWRRPDAFTGFDDDDDLPLTDLQFNSSADGEYFRGPFPILNCSLNLGGSADLSVHTRQSASFTLTPLSCGNDRLKVGFAPVEAGGFGDGPTLGQAISVSGAAASPNMGYNTSPLVAVLLTMFNVRLAWWFPNPGGKKWKKDSPVFSLSYLIWEFLGLADENSNFVNVSDGGHFENLGIYELVRRRAKVIIASDAECDPDLAFGSLGNVIRICETDFGAKIDIDVAAIRKQAEADLSFAHCAVGRITYSNGSLGYLIYLKSSITGDEDAGIQQYRSAHPDFPHQSTGDQFFSEDQFESYRRLGHHIADLTFRGVEGENNMVALASKLYDLWAPAGFTSTAFVSHTKALDLIWDRFRNSPALKPLLKELVDDKPNSLRAGSPTHEELCACMELLQLMENVFINLRLDDFWRHPDNRGWAIIFTMWAKSPTFRAVWNKVRPIFGIRFEYFCGERLGLETDRPVVRI